MDMINDIYFKSINVHVEYPHKPPVLKAAHGGYVSINMTHPNLEK